jgi:hypothetical protein
MIIPTKHQIHVKEIFNKKVKWFRYTSWMAHLGERRYSSYSFLTSALEGGKWSASRPGSALPPEKEPRYPLYRRLGGPQSRTGRRDKHLITLAKSVR